MMTMKFGSKWMMRKWQHSWLELGWGVLDKCTKRLLVEMHCVRYLVGWPREGITLQPCWCTKRSSILCTFDEVVLLISSRSAFNAKVLYRLFEFCSRNVTSAWNNCSPSTNKHDFIVVLCSELCELWVERHAGSARGLAALKAYLSKTSMNPFLLQYHPIHFCRPSGYEGPSFGFCFFDVS